MNSPITIAILALVAAFVVVPQLLAATKRISPERARQLVEDGALIVDVRTPGEYRSGHIDGAINIPLQDLSVRLDELGGRDDHIVLYCRSGNRSAQARRKLEKAGFKAVHDLGGLHRWQAPAAAR